MRKLIIFISLIGNCLTMNAQVLMRQLNLDRYKNRVKLVDEFINRFNGDELRPDIKPSDPDYRVKNTLVLFDGEMFKSMKDPKFLQAQEMVKTVLDNNIHLNFSDTTWVAKAKCCGKFKNKDVDFTLYLNVENRREDMYKWVIARAEGEIFQLKPSLKSDKIIIEPDDHEINFMTLNRITTEKDSYITNYAQKNFAVDETSVFFSYVYQGLLDIEYVKSLEFIFLQVPGYQFTISNIEREKYNEGWLISSFSQMTDEKKRLFLNQIYNNKSND